MFVWDYIRRPIIKPVWQNVMLAIKWLKPPDLAHHAFHSYNCALAPVPVMLKYTCAVLATKIGAVTKMGVLVLKSNTMAPLASFFRSTTAAAFVPSVDISTPPTVPPSPCWP